MDVLYSEPDEENEHMKYLTGKSFQKARKKKKSTLISEKNVPKVSFCPLCIRLSKINKKKEHEIKPEAFLSIIGESDDYLPNDTIKNQLKSGLIELIKTTNICVITEGRSTSVGQIVEDVIRGKEKTSKSGVLHKGFDYRTKHEERTRMTPDELDRNDMETCITKCTEHSEIPLILIVVGGEGFFFHTAMDFLKRNFHILVIDGSGRVADFISTGYKMSTKKNRETLSVFSESFEHEMTEAAKTLCKPYNEQQFIDHNTCKKLTEQLKKGLEMFRENIHVHSLYDTSYTLVMTIQDILFQLFCEDKPELSTVPVLSFGKNESREENITDKILQSADLWNRPDIARKNLFNLENRRVLQRLQGELEQEKSSLSKLFVNSLVENRVEFVKMVLEYVLERDNYRCFLEKHLKYLYTKTPGLAGEFISTYIDNLKQPTSKDMTIVEMINDIVIQILGSQNMKPFQDGDEKNKNDINTIRKDDTFKHLFIWAVLMNRKDLALLFWKKNDSDYICSALYASALAKKFASKLTEVASVIEFNDQLEDLLESSRHYEDLAYSVMSELYRMDRKHARKLLVTEILRYDSTTIFAITEKFTLMKFMGHAACQTKLFQIWMGRILGDMSVFQAMSGAFVPFYLKKKVRLDFERNRNSVMPHTETQEIKQNKRLSHSSDHAERDRTGMIKWYYFYTSPSTKFVITIYMYIAMLVVFSLFVLTDLHPICEKFPSVYEYIVYVWAASTLIEEIRQAHAFKTFSLKILMNRFSFWTLVDKLKFIMLIISVCLRFTLEADKFYHARMTYAITLGIFIINSMQFWLISKHIGPKVIMVGRIVLDLIVFILIFAAFVFGFGVIHQATMYPNSMPGFQLFKDIVYMPYWQLYGELFLDQFEGMEPSSCTDDVELYRNGTFPRCPHVNQINTLLLSVYMVLTNIVLVNMLIAMLSQTYATEQDTNVLVWKFRKYLIIKEYYDKSLVPPLNIISYIKRAVQYCTCNERNRNKFKRKRTAAKNEKLARLEKNAVDCQFNSSTQHNAKSMDAEKDVFVDSNGKETNLQDQLNVLSSEVNIMQNKLEEILKAVKNDATK